MAGRAALARRWHSDCEANGAGGTGVNKRTFGIITGIIGSAFGAWFWTKRRGGAQNAAPLTPAREHGTVIFDNTPTAVEGNPL